MQGAAAERFVVFALRVLAVAFAVVGLLYLFLPSPTLDVLSDVGEVLGNHTRAAHTQEYIWLSLGFAYMAVITGICLIAQTDVVRFRPLLLLLAAGKLASSSTSLAFFLLQGQVFAYLLGALVDGTLILLALWLYVLIGRIDRPLAPDGRRPLGRTELRALGALCEAMAPGLDGLPPAEREVDVSGPVARFLEVVSPVPSAVSAAGALQCRDTTPVSTTPKRMASSLRFIDPSQEQPGCHRPRRPVIRCFRTP